MRFLEAFPFIAAFTQRVTWNLNEQIGNLFAFVTLRLDLKPTQNLNPSRYGKKDKISTVKKINFVNNKFISLKLLKALFSRLT